MDNKIASKKPGIGKIGAARRQSVKVEQKNLVEEKTLGPDNSLPLVIQPNVEALNFLTWARNNKDLIDDRLLKHGGILFRGFQIGEVAEFEEFVVTTAGTPLEYRERSSPRHQVSGNIYTSTDYPPDQPIFPHNENSYQAAFPTRIVFFCVTAPEKGGETPIANCRNIYQRVKPEVREKFTQKKCMYVRNFGSGFGLEWQTVFQTEDKAEVEAYCQKVGIQTEWVEGDRLRTRMVRPAVLKHPQTGEMSWFNHATFFHVSTLPEKIREALLAEFDEEELPSNTYYGDGTPIELETLEHLREMYKAETVAFPWQKGDILLLDNLATAHGRNPYEGPRKIVVGMTEAITWDDV